MRNRAILSSLVIAAFAVTAASAQNLVRIARPNGAPVTISQAVQQMHASGTKRIRRSKIGTNVIEVETADIAFIIPAAGSIPGANGTFFKSDFSIGNFNNNDQKVGIGWLKVGTDNSKAPLQYFTIPANTVASFNDFVGTQLNQSGLGALLIIAYDSTGQNVDQSALIDGFSRIWTPQPGVANGTVSQGFPAVSIMDSEGDFTAYAMGLRQDANFRTNVGIVNLDTVAHTWTVKSLTGAQSSVTVQPYSLSQGSIAAGSAPASGYVTLMITPTDSADFFWSAYGTSVDNVTGDGWVSRATQ